MKKLLYVSMLLVLSVALVGCKKKNTNTNDQAVVTPPVADDTMPAEDDAVADEGMYSEYQLDVDIVSTDADGVEYGVQTRMYKKGANALYVIEEMTGPQELPFTPKQNLLVGTDLYSNIEINGESMWFKADGVQDQADAMFDLGKMQEQIMADAAGAEMVEEEIDGQMMECYLTPTGGKVCLLDSIFAYGEDYDTASGMKSVIRVSNYSDTVDDSIFELPAEEEVKDMSAFMQIMMESLEASVSGEVMVLPEEELVGDPLPVEALPVE